MVEVFRTIARAFGGWLHSLRRRKRKMEQVMGIEPTS